VGQYVEAARQRDIQFFALIAMRCSGDLRFDCLPVVFVERGQARGLPFKPYAKRQPGAVGSLRANSSFAAKVSNIGGCYFPAIFAVGILTCSRLRLGTWFGSG